MTTKAKVILNEVELYMAENDLDASFSIGLNVLTNEPIDECEPPNVKKVDEALTAVFLISFLLAMPNVMKILVKSFNLIYKGIMKLFGKTVDTPVFIEKLLKFAAKWHKSYIKVLKKILKVAGIFKAAKLDDDEKQTIAAEVLFYTLIFGAAVYSGIGAADAMIKAIQQSSLLHGKTAALEAVLTGLKSKEVGRFVSKFGATPVAA
jgi:hypothetical protein